MKLMHYRKLYSHEYAETILKDFSKEELIEEICERLTIKEWKLFEKKYVEKESSK